MRKRGFSGRRRTRHDRVPGPTVIVDHDVGDLEQLVAARRPGGDRVGVRAGGQRDHPDTALTGGLGQFDRDARRTQLAAAPPAYLEELTKEYIQGLPGHADSGKPIMRHFATVKEMRAYVEERRSAARKYYHEVLGRL